MINKTHSFYFMCNRQYNAILKLKIMPSKTTGRTRSRRGDDESSSRSSKREQGWGAVAKRQEEVKNGRKRLKTLFANFG